MSDGVGRTFWNKPGPSSTPIPTTPERGDRCPNCDWPILKKDEPIGFTPITAAFTCVHCGWSMTVEYHTPFDNHAPGPGPWPGGH